MSYKIWRSNAEVAIESGGDRITLSVGDAEALGRDLTVADPKHMTTKQRHALVAKMWKAGAKRSEIINVTGYTAGTINQLRPLLGLPPRRAPMPAHVREAITEGRQRLRAMK